MYFVLKARRLRKKKKKEAIMVAMENKFKMLAKSFDADAHVNEHLAAAKQGGWGIDIWAEHQTKLQAASGQGGGSSKS